MNARVQRSRSQQEPSEDLAQRGRFARLAARLAVPMIWVSIAVALVHFTTRQAWLRPFLRDLRPWLLRPEIAGGWVAPTSWPLIVAVLAGVMAVAWLVAALAFHGTALSRDLPARTGLTIILAIAMVGYAGMLALAIGRLDAVTLALLLAGIAFVVGAAWVVLGRPSLRVAATARTGGSRLWLIGLPFAVAIVGFSLVHSAMAPVTEWDAVIYHAGTAKLWFLGRPDPPLLYGPSVGVEISANYPPIFPAAGAAFSTLVGHFDDIYLRLASPVLFAGLLLVLFAWVRSRSGSSMAWLAVILTLGCPLLVMYTAWPTSYMLLSALTLAVLLLCHLAATTGRTSLWLSAGGVAGMAMLTHFYGWLVLGFAVAAMFLWQRSRKGGVNLALFFAAALLVASPWLLRNLIRLHDPVYPLGSPIFHGIGLVQPLWAAAQAEIRQNALGQFGGADAPNLRAYEFLAAMFSRHFLAIGLVGPLIFAAWRAFRKDRFATYLGTGLLILLGVQMAPGWYWLRSLVPALAIGAFLGAAALGSIVEWVGRRRAPFRGVSRVVAIGTSVGAVLVSAGVGTALAFAGPNQDTWTTGLTGSHDMLTAVRNLGSERNQLWTVYGGDFLCWQWLNSRLSSGERVATLDLRLYYFDRPQDLFYLDGEEALPLLTLQDPATVADYLQSQGVKYIMIPAWAIAPTPARHPAVDLLPLMHMLGRSGGFPLVAAFAPAGANVPTMVYSVDILHPPISVPAVYPGYRASIPGPSDTSFRFARGATDPRIYAPTSDTDAWFLEFSYDNSSAGRFDLNLYDYGTQTWQIGFYQEERTGKGGWVDVSVRLPSSSRGWVDLGVYAAGADLSIADLRVTVQLSDLSSSGAP